MQLPDVEVVARRVHEQWLEKKRSQGITSRLSVTGEELMVPYSDLSEESKELNRDPVRTVYDAIEDLTEIA